MAAVINRIDLPCDVKGVIKSFYYNDMGYTYEQNEYIKKEKKKNRAKNLRLKVELSYFRRTGCSVGWLKKSSTTGYGAYLSIAHELQEILNSRDASTISYQDSIDILYHMYYSNTILHIYKPSISKLLSIHGYKVRN